MQHSKSAILQNAVAATGNGNTFDCSGLASMAVSVTGSFTGTVTFEGSNDGGANWYAVPFFNVGGTNASTATAPGMFVTYFFGYTLFRARVTWTSGTSVTVTVSGNG